MPASREQSSEKRVSNKKFSYVSGPVRNSVVDESGDNVLVGTKQSAKQAGHDSIIQTQQSDKDLQFYPM